MVLSGLERATSAHWQALALSEVLPDWLAQRTGGLRIVEEPLVQML